MTMLVAVLGTFSEVGCSGFLHIRLTKKQLKDLGDLAELGGETKDDVVCLMIEVAVPDDQVIIPLKV